MKRQFAVSRISMKPNGCTESVCFIANQNGIHAPVHDFDAQQHKEQESQGEASFVEPWSSEYVGNDMRAVLFVAETRNRAHKKHVCAIVFVGGVSRDALVERDRKHVVVAGFYKDQLILPADFINKSQVGQDTRVHFLLICFPWHCLAIK